MSSILRHRKWGQRRLLLIRKKIARNNISCKSRLFSNYLASLWQFFRIRPNQWQKNENFTSTIEISHFYRKFRITKTERHTQQTTIISTWQPEKTMSHRFIKSKLFPKQESESLKVSRCRAWSCFCSLRSRSLQRASRRSKWKGVSSVLRMPTKRKKSRSICTTGISVGFFSWIYHFSGSREFRDAEAHQFVAAALLTFIFFFENTGPWLIVTEAVKG